MSDQSAVLYPLNALINSQKDRLLAGTAPYGQDALLPLQRKHAA